MRTPLIFLSLLLLSDAQKYIKFYKDECYGSKKYAVNVTCRITPKTRYLSTANFDADLIREVKNVTVHIKMYKFYNQFRPFLIDEWANFCKILNPKDFLGGASYFMRTAYRVIKRFTNIIRCHYDVSDDCVVNEYKFCLINRSNTTTSGMVSLNTKTFCFSWI